jgi:uncharacterized tellurite resistance protein B-like protein
MTLNLLNPVAHYPIVMSEITYDSIKPLIEDKKVEGNTVFVSFRAFGSGELIQSTSTIKPVATKKKEESNQLKNAFIGLFSKIFTEDADKSAKGDWSDKEINEAVVNAFRNISGQFYYNADQKQWSLAKKMGEYQKSMQDAPVEKAEDKAILSRMLAELVNADGEVMDEEVDFLKSILNADKARVEELLNMPPLTAEEVANVSPAVRKTVFLLAWTVVLIDQDLHEKEKTRVMEIGRMLQLPEPHLYSLMKIAQCYIVENAYAQNLLVKSEINELAKNIDLSPEEANRCIDDYNARVRG